MPLHPAARSERPCWHCSAFDGLDAQGTAALCARAGCCRLRSAPAAGCASWQREPGADDEPGPPPAFRSGSDAGWRERAVGGWQSADAAAQRAG